MYNGEIEPMPQSFLLHQQSLALHDLLEERSVVFRNGIQNSAGSSDVSPVLYLTEVLECESHVAFDWPNPLTMES